MYIQNIFSYMCLLLNDFLWDNKLIRIFFSIYQQKRNRKIFSIYQESINLESKYITGELKV